MSGCTSRPWISWGAAALAAYALKLHYSRASAGDLQWILAPTARIVEWLRGETLVFDPGAGWVAPGGGYHIAPACAGVNFTILVLTVAVFGFAHRLPSARRRLAWWLGAVAGAYLATLAVNTVRILAAVELYQMELHGGWLTPERAHRLLGTVFYLGALWGIWVGLERVVSSRREKGQGSFLVVPAAYLGLTLAVPLVNGAWGRSGGRFVEHAIMVGLVTVVAVAVLGWGRRTQRTARTQGT